MRSISSADGTEIAYERTGGGPPLAFVHGTGGEPGERAPYLPHLTDAFELFALERRGWGPSDSGDDHARARHVEDVRALCDRVESDPVLFGHSFGGLCALETARRTRVDRLVVYEPAVLVGDHRESADAAAAMDEHLDDGDPEGAAAVALRAMTGADDPESLPNWSTFVERADVIRDEFRVVESYRLPETLDVGVPALVLTGESSPQFLRDGARAVRDAIPEARLVELDGVGHSGERAPERVAEEVRAFAAGSDGE